jgi:hypothetical protein
MTDPMTVRAEYFRIFREQATQLNGFPEALAWHRIDVGHADGVTAEDAAAWANAGYTAEEAAPLIRQGITPDLAMMGDDALVAEHGVIGAGVLKLQHQHPGAAILVDPDVTEPTRKS